MGKVRSRIMGRRVLALSRLSLFLCAIASLPLAGQIPDKKKVGSETCLSCHEDIGKAFGATAHSRGYRGQAVDCEACHGPGSVHADDPQKTNIVQPDRLAPAEANEICLSCHGQSKNVQHWPTSRHSAADLKCAECHNVHGIWTADHALRSEKATEGCLACHPQVRKAMFQRSSHPMRNGQMGCPSCHSAHGSAGDKALLKVSINENCVTCHMEKRGPFLFEHPPVREDCLSCHVAHGSNNTMLLKAPTNRLCQSCHLLGHHQTVASQPGQIWVQNRACVNCHAQIHGSNHPSGAIFQR